MASIPFLIGAHRNLREAVPVQPAAAPVAPTTSPEQQTQPSGVDWNAFKSKLTALISQPQTDSQAVMQLIADMLAQAPVGSSDRQQMVNLIKAFQTNQTMVAKVPQLQQVSLESHVRNGKMLQEAPKAAAKNRPAAKPRVRPASLRAKPPTATAPATAAPAATPAPATELKRSEIDKIFMQIAQYLAHQWIINPGLFPQPAPQPAQQGQQQQTRGQPAQQGQPLQKISPYNAKNVTADAIKQTMRSVNFNPADKAKWLDPIIKKLEELSKKGPVNLGMLIKEYDRQLASQRVPYHITDMPAEIQDVLINAANNTP